MKFNTINYEKESGIGIITLDRPKSMNALNIELIGELNRLFDGIADDDEILVVIITGSEEVFCAGADITEISAMATPLDAHRFVTSLSMVFSKIENLKKPVIAAVAGLALGGGCELALACDMRIAAENARFGQPEINMGVIPGGGGTQRLPRLIGVGRAKELLYIGDPIDAQEAYRIGLANKIVPANALMDESKKMAIKLISKPAFALEMIKMVINAGINMDMHSALAHEARCFEILFSTEDQKEGAKAFLEKRKSIFKGR